VNWFTDFFSGRVAEALIGDTRHTAPTLARVSVTGLIGCHRRMLFKIEAGQPARGEFYEQTARQWRGQVWHKHMLPLIARAVKEFAGASFEFERPYSRRHPSGFTVSGRPDLIVTYPSGQRVLFDLKTTATPAAARTRFVANRSRRLQIAGYSWLTGIAAGGIIILHVDEPAGSAFSCMTYSPDEARQALLLFEVLVERWAETRRALVSALISDDESPSGGVDASGPCGYCEFVHRCERMRDALDVVRETRPRPTLAQLKHISGDEMAIKTIRARGMIAYQRARDENGESGYYYCTGAE